jgi:hypothetical protein
MMQSMVIQMNDRQLQTLSQLQAFLDGTAAVDFCGGRRGALRFYRTYRAPFCLWAPEASAEGVVLRFLERVSGYSRQQLTRLVKRGAARAPLLKRYRGA